MLRLDNTTAVTYIRKHGGTHSRLLLAEVVPILDWAEQLLEALTATYIPGVTHVQADFLSSYPIDKNEWALHPQETFLQLPQTTRS